MGKWQTQDPQGPPHLSPAHPAPTPAESAGMGSSSWPSPGVSITGQGQVQGIPNSHTRGHFLPFLLIHALVPSWAIQEFPVPRLTSRAWGQGANSDGAGVWADDWGATGPKTMGFWLGQEGGSSGCSLDPEQKGKALVLGGSDPSHWAGWSGGCNQALAG